MKTTLYKITNTFSSIQKQMRITLTVSLALLLICILESYAQSNYIQLEKSYGGSMSEGGNYIEQTSDGGFITAGFSYSNDGDVSGHHGMTDFTDGWIVRLNSDGDTLWTKSLGGTRNEKANQIKQTPDGGFIIAAQATSNDGDVTQHYGSLLDNDVWIVKLNSSGDTMWTKVYGGTDDDYASAIDLTYDGGFIVGATSESNDIDVSGNNGYYDYWILRLDSLGDTLWTKSYGGSNGDYLESIKTTADSGCIIAGSSTSNNGDVTGNHGARDYWIVKLDINGALVWQKALGGSAPDYGISVEQTNDGGFIVAGAAQSNDGDVSGNNGYFDYWIVKLNNSGDTLWTKAYGGSNLDWASSIKQTCDGGYIIAGYSTSNNGDVTDHHGSTDSTDSWIVKLDEQGNMEWTQSLGGANPDETYSIIQIPDYYVMVGFSRSSDGDVTSNQGDYDLWLVKMVSNRNTPDICLVTVDSATKKNMVIWEKDTGMNILSYNIYKEGISAAVFDFIGNVPYDSLSIFIDYISNPKVKSNKYKISIIDSCGNESFQSAYHKTMRLITNLGLNDVVNLTFEKYEGFTYGTHFIYRGTSLFSIDSIDAIPNTDLSYTDLSPPLSADSLYYVVVINHPTVCTASKMGKDYNASKSNTTSIEGYGPLSITATVIDATQGICDGSATVIATGGFQPYTYLWDDTLAQTTSTADSLCSGNYTVTVTDGIGNIVTDSVTVDEITAIETLTGFQTLSELKIYPNPNRGIFNLEIKGIEEIEGIRVLNILGQEIYQSAIINPPRHEVGISTPFQQSEIDLSGYPSGIYNLLIITRERVENVRIIIE